MKFLSAIIVFLVMGWVLGWGILRVMGGHPWLLVVSVLAFVLAFAKFGCLPGKAH